MPNEEAKDAGRFTLKIPADSIFQMRSRPSLAPRVGIDDEVIKMTLIGFNGIWRRFERLGSTDGATIISDYGHHPTAIAQPCWRARILPRRRLVLAYQPHQRHRTKALMNDFAAAFDGVDLLVLSDIYDVAGREDSNANDVTRPCSPRPSRPIPKPALAFGRRSSPH